MVIVALIVLAVALAGAVGWAAADRRIGEVVDPERADDDSRRSLHRS